MAIFFPRGHLAMCGNIFGGCNWLAVLIQWAEARDAAKHPTI